MTLRRVRVAVQTGDIELRSTLLDKCRAVVAELLSTLDHENGDDVARNLSALYTFLLCEMVDIGLKPDVARIERLTRMIGELRDAWAVIAAQPAPVAAAVGA